MPDHAKGTQPAEVRRRAALRALLGIAQAIRHRQLVCAIIRAARVRFYPYAVGWRNHDAFVLGLVSGEAGWSWRWIGLAELETFFTRKGDWIAVPPTKRPPLDFLTHLFYQAE